MATKISADLSTKVAMKKIKSVGTSSDRPSFAMMSRETSSTGDGSALSGSATIHSRGTRLAKPSPSTTLAAIRQTSTAQGLIPSARKNSWTMLRKVVEVSRLAPRRGRRSAREKASTLRPKHLCGHWVKTRQLPGAGQISPRHLAVNAAPRNGIRADPGRNRALARSHDVHDTRVRARLARSCACPHEPRRGCFLQSTKKRPWPPASTFAAPPSRLPDPAPADRRVADRPGPDITPPYRHSRAGEG